MRKSAGYRSILHFTDRKTCKNASMAGKVWREQPFVFEMTDENDQAFGQLIQGVIDLYIVEMMRLQ